MAKAMKGATGFVQMPKMMTDEPSVILKMKKGGHVNMKKGGKAEHGHKTMEHHLDGGMAGMSVAPVARGLPPALAGRAPMKPSMAMRRKAMTGMATPLMKKGGKVHKAVGGEIETRKEQDAEDKRFEKIEKELRHHEHMPAHLAHKGMAAGGSASERMKNLAKARACLEKHKEGGGAHHLDKAMEHLEKCKTGGSKHHYAKGGKVDGGKKMDNFETLNTIENNQGPFVKSKVVGAGRDTVHGTGEVKDGNGGGYKHGGKVHHKSGHPEGSIEHHKHMAKHHAKMHKEGGSAHHKKMMEHHKALCGGGKYAVGGSVGSRVPSETNESETRGKSVMGGTIEGNEHYYENTDLHSAMPDRKARGTGQVDMANDGGFKRGGHAKKHHYAKGGMVDLEGTIEGNEGHFTNYNVDTTPKGKSHTKTGEVKESNAGGFKRGGHAKKHFATGGAVNKQGSAVVMPQANKPPSRATRINELSGVFKKGGRVKKFADGTDKNDLSRGGFDSVAKEETADNQAMRDMMLKPLTSGYNMVKNALGFGTPPSGSVTKTVKSTTVVPPKKRGGSIKK